MNSCRHMKKKLVFVSLVLFFSLTLLQYFVLGNIFASNYTSDEAKPESEVVVQPVQNGIYSAGDYFVVLKDGKYYVYKKSPKAI